MEPSLHMYVTGCRLAESCGSDVAALGFRTEAGGKVNFRPLPSAVPVLMKVCRRLRLVLGACHSAAEALRETIGVTVRSLADRAAR